MPTDHDHEPEQLAEILRRNREVTRLRREWESRHLEAKTAKAALEEAQDALNDFIEGLDEEYPLFDAPAATESEVARDAFASLLSVGYTEATARDAIDRAMSGGRIFRSVSELVDAVYQGTRDALPRPDPADLRPIRGEANDLIEAAMNEAEGRRADPDAGFDDGGDGQTHCETEEEAAVREADSPGVKFRRLDVDVLELPPVQDDAVQRLEITTLGDLDDFLTDTPFADLEKTLDVSDLQTRALLETFYRFKSRYLGFDQVPDWAGEVPECDECHLDCDFAPAPEPSRFDRSPRAKFECPRCFKLMKTVEPPKPEPEPFVPNYEEIEATVGGKKKASKKKAKVVDQSPLFVVSAGNKVGTSPVYAVRAETEEAARGIAVGQHPAGTTLQVRRDTGEVKRLGLPVLPDETPDRPEPEPSLFTVHPNGSKDPVQAVLAPNRTAAIYWAKPKFNRVDVRPADPSTVDPAMRCARVDKHGAELPALLFGTRVEPAPVRICNRCNTERPATVGVCPDCGSPEFRLPPGTEAEPAKPKRTRKPKAAEARA